jgi:integrase
MRVLFALGIYTGLRLGDCATLLWSEVDGTRALIRRIPMKTARRKARTVTIPIHPVLLQMLSKLPRNTEYVLPAIAKTYNKGDYRLVAQVQDHFKDCGIRLHQKGTGFKTVKNKDGSTSQVHTGKRAVVEVGFHSLRHTFVSLCRESSAPLAVVEAIVGHSNPAMTRHYTHVGEAASLAAVAALPDLTTRNSQSVALPVSRMVEAEPIRKLAAKLTSKNAKRIKKQLLEVLK